MSEPNKATMLARLVDVKPSGSEGNIVKDIVFLDKKENRLTSPIRTRKPSPL